MKGRPNAAVQAPAVVYLKLHAGGAWRALAWCKSQHGWALQEAFWWKPVRERVLSACCNKETLSPRKHAYRQPECSVELGGNWFSIL